MGANDIRVRPESQYIFAETLARRCNVRVCVGIRGRGWRFLDSLRSHFRYCGSWLIA